MSLAEEARAVRERITDRLRELEPMVREYDELRQLAAEMGLDALPGRSSGSVTAAPSGSHAVPSAGTDRGGRPGTSGPRSSPPPAGRAVSAGDVSERVLEAVRAAPGKTVAEYAASLELSPTALYRPVRELTNDGALVKRSRQLFPASG